MQILKELYCIAGRGTGKSTRIIARLSANRVLDMPGASFSFTGATYTQLQQRTVASVVAGWADLGLVEGKFTGVLEDQVGENLSLLH